MPTTGGAVMKLTKPEVDYIYKMMFSSGAETFDMKMERSIRKKLGEIVSI